jgi:hypothetical protein
MAERDGGGLLYLADDSVAEGSSRSTPQARRHALLCHACALAQRARADGVASGYVGGAGILCYGSAVAAEYVRTQGGGQRIYSGEQSGHPRNQSSAINLLP